MQQMYARADALTRPWQPTPGRPRNEGEQAVAKLLSLQGLPYDEEDLLLVTSTSDDGMTFGVCPDFRLHQTNNWAEQYIEVTSAAGRTRLKEKCRRIRHAQALHGVQIMLVLTGKPLYRPPGIVAVGLDELQSNPAQLLQLLRPRRLRLLKQPA